MELNTDTYKKEMQQELETILNYWMLHTKDEVNGGFIGRIDSNNQIVAEAPKGAVLNARILWSFSAAYNLTGNKIYLETASRAFDYICRHFIDREFGGVYWTVDYKGQPLDTKKQIYALAFTIYAFCEFYKASKQSEAIIESIELYDAIIKHSYNETYGGYTEALARDWTPLDDLRLSAKDANEKKSMNTHLHVLEAFTVLFTVWPYEPVKHKIAALINNFLTHIINPATHHQYLFFDDDWTPKSATVSYGHDIEAAWLLQEAAVVIADEDLIKKTKLAAIKMSDAVKAGIDSDGGLWYEYEPATNHLIKEKHMWPQAEAMVGYFNAYQNTGDKNYLQYSYAAWQFVQQHIHDTTNGEWFWGVKENYAPMEEDKVGLWKCPYHNSRACIEIIKRINQIENNL
jgi:mannobiose 2-epimerase